MPKKRFQSRNIARWVAIGLVFCVAAGFVFVVLSDDSRLETAFEQVGEDPSSNTSDLAPPQSDSDLAQPEPTLPFEVTEVQNQAPQLYLEDLDCWTEMPDTSDSIRIQLVVEDPDSETISLDLGILIEERVLDISDSISQSAELSGSGKVQAIFSLPADVKNYLHLIAHATDGSGARSEAALILPQSNGNCASG